MNENSDQRLDRLFRAYRDACPDVEGRSDFMPKLWAKIEVRRAASSRWRRFTQGFISAAAAMCLGMSLLLIAPITAPNGSQRSYLEILDEEHDTMAYADIDDDGDLNQ